MKNMTDNIVSDWLKSLNLDCYAQEFFDNGYDELEVCKQIGDPDLDAIGVTKGTHRKKLLQAVTRLREEGGTSVYFTLEDTESSKPEDPGEYSSESVDFRLSYSSSAASFQDGLKNRVRSDRHSSKKKQSLISYPPLQLKIITRDKLFEDGIDLSSPPYTKQDNTACKSSLTALAVKYASELKTYIEEVMGCLLELRLWSMHQDSELFYSTTPVATAVDDISGQILPARATPPPIPACPPPQVSHMDRCDLQSVYSRYDESNYQPTYIPLESGMCCIPRRSRRDYEDIDKKKTSTLGRFFRNMGFRRSGKKHSYKQHNGDLNAYEITMKDDDRMALMLMVKEGKITIEHALEVVKRYEDERKKELQQLKSYYNKKKKQKDNKPVKSPSAIYTEAARHCDVCQRIVSNDPHLPMRVVCSDPSHRNECFQHRRVHSVSHIDYSPSHGSPQIARAMSCSPTRVHLTHSSVLNSPVNMYSPGHFPKVYTPVMMQEVKSCKGIYAGYYHHHGDHHHSDSHSVYSDRTSALRTSACVHDSPSRNSLISTSSEHSGECQSHSLMHSDVAVMRNDDLNYCSNSSAMSIGSSASPATGGIGVCKHVDDERSRSAKPRYPTGTTKSASSLESNQSASSGMSGSFQSPSPGSGKSSHSMEDGSNPVHECCSNMVIVHTNYEPAKIETDMLALKRGDVIRVITRSQSGLFRGVLHGKTGWFKSSHVEPLKHALETPGGQKKDFPPRHKRIKPATVREFLQQIGLEHLERTFVENGFDHIESFFDLDQSDLNVLHILNPQHQARLLSASKLLTENDDFNDQQFPRNNLHCFNQTSTCLSPSRMKTMELHHSHSCPTSRDSAYASSEHIYPRENIHKLMLNTQLSQPVIEGGQFSPLHSNKENLQPNYVFKMGYRGSNSYNDGRSDSCSADDKVSDLDKSDREYTEEDKEVFEITKNSVLEKQKENLDFVVHEDKSVESSHVTNSVDMSFNGQVQADPDIVMCSYAGTQTSPKYGANICDNNLNIKNGVCDLIGQTQMNFDHRTKPQPFPRKNVPKMGALRDAQVQVMSPLANVPVMKNSQSAERSFNFNNLPQNQLPKDSSCNGIIVDPKVHLAVGKRKPAVPNRRTKSMDDTNQGPVHSHREFKSVRKSLVNQVTAKLASEKIDMSKEPYSSVTGHCGIPPLLVQRYAEELRHDLEGVAVVMDQVRIHQLCSQGRPVVPCDNLVESCTAACDLKFSSIPEFLISIGLPMYTKSVSAAGYSTLDDLLSLSDDEITNITKASPRHIKRTIHALHWVRSKLAASQGRKEVNLIDRV